MIGALAEERMTTQALRDRLAVLACEVRFGERLAPYTTFQVGGPADALALPRDEGELAELLGRCRSEGLPVTVLGGGANTLVRDGGVRGVTVALIRGFRGLRLLDEGDKGGLIESGAGEKIPALVRFAAEGGWEGLECLAGVPGTVGGAVAMNAGTATRWVQEVVEGVRWISLAEGGAEWLPKEGLTFEYRHTQLPAPGLILAARFRVRRGDANALRDYLRRHAAVRRERQPWGVPCAGSIFRNPPGDYAGRLIEAAGLKGRRVGGAEVSRVHANFLVNRGGASASDVLRLIEEVRAELRARFGVELVLELHVIGEDAS